MARRKVKNGEKSSSRREKLFSPFFTLWKMRYHGNVTLHFSYFFSGIQPFNGHRVCTILYQVQFFVPKRVAWHRLCLQRHPAGIWRLFGLGNKKREDSGAERFTPHWYICVQRVFSVRSWHDCG